MKKLLLIMIVAITTLSSCNDNASELPKEEASLLGTWELYSETNKDGILTIESSVSECISTVTFLKDGKGKEKEYLSTKKPCDSSRISDFSYTVTGNKLNVVSKDYANTIIILKLTATSLVIQGENGRKAEYRKL